MGCLKGNLVMAFTFSPELVDIDHKSVTDSGIVLPQQTNTMSGFLMTMNLFPFTVYICSGSLNLYTWVLVTQGLKKYVLNNHIGRECMRRLIRVTS